MSELDFMERAELRRLLGAASPDEIVGALDPDTRPEIVDALTERFEIEFRKGYDQAVREITRHFDGYTADSVLAGRDVQKILRDIWGPK